MQEVWLEKLEREYADSLAESGDAQRDAWSGGNVNLRPVVDSDDEDDDEEDVEADNDHDDGKEERDGIYLGSEDPAIREAQDDKEDGDPLMVSEESDDEEEMAELRRKVLLSRPFTDIAEDTSKSHISTVAPPAARARDSDDESSLTDNGEDDAFDNIINATPDTDRTGIQAKQRSRGQEHISASFSRTILEAPRKR